MSSGENKARVGAVQGVKPPGIRELTPRSVLCGIVVAAIMVGLVKGITIGLGFTQWSTAVIYLMMLLVLLFRPRGLFGERIQRFE